jgi:hypothetical protein
MSKRSRRLRRPNLPPEAFNSPAANAPSQLAAVTGGTTTSAPAPARRVTEINWQEEYSEVLGDLKRTAILAVIMITAMGALSFIIR